ncbi:dipeptide ABC transporter ATP-binding protein [Desulfallas sp. Bu1-1]|uniref:ABC transporter ATP-binding protein n=1 Tax=Desulfallas sp. Bu1-1 TaxID=2787620 RepID=UPI00189DB78E|nr:dipeptide ABC transporter ATP-binding protein [Desulfallas sp. Bu1-1]MBF7084017.1 dipeptide ABC transporter ATP-binding protein [Desulfallas sp. Bu1-1]
MKQGEVLVDVRNLKKYFNMSMGFVKRQRPVLKAVDDVSFSIARGETLGLVGESGCGKTTLGRTLLRLYEPTAGKVFYRGQNIFAYNRGEMQRIRRKMQIIFQDPYASLNPRMTVSDIIGEPLDIHGLVRGDDRKERIHELLRLVGLNPEHAARFPHEFSGGQRQRIGIARALAVEPEFIICDEPISALDVSIQAQIVNMLEELQDNLGLTYLFIAHDLAMVKHISDRVAVMYMGKIVELSESRELYRHPLHPYSQALLSAVPVPDPQVAKGRQRIILEGDAPSPIDPPGGCRFRARCPRAKAVCQEQEPTLRNMGGGHQVACHLV